MPSIMETHVKELYETRDLWHYCSRCRVLEKNPSWIGPENDVGHPVCSICWSGGKTVILPKGELPPKEILKILKGEK
jgi:hypothetical protein